MKVSELKDQIGQPGPRPLLYCTVCGAEYSANAGDYWNCSRDMDMLCCDEPLQLVMKRTVYKKVD